MKKLAIFQVEFEEDDMIGKEDLKEFWNNDLLKYMQETYEDEGIGIFDEPFKLIAILDKPEYIWIKDKEN
jgi:hypothetical protein